MNTDKKIIKIPDAASVDNAMKVDDPLLLLFSHDGQTLIVSAADHAMEHVILLRLAGFKDTELDRFYRIVVNRDGADWTFVCPENYKGITDRTRRIKEFYDNGFDSIHTALKLIDYKVNISIPHRYRRHFNELSDF